MKIRPTLYFFCGKMASGKSTLASQLSVQHKAMLISEDQLLADLYPGEITDVASYVEFSGRVKAALEGHIVALLNAGVSVVLDFPANTVKQRRWFRQLLDKTDVQHELHHLIVPESQCLLQLSLRNVASPERAATDTPEMFAMMSRYFEAPNAEEGFSIVKH